MSLRRSPRHLLVAAISTLPACSLVFGWDEISDGARTVASDGSDDVVAEVGADDVATGIDAPVEAGPSSVVANADFVVLDAPGTHEITLDEKCVMGVAMLWGAGGTSFDINHPGGKAGHTYAAWQVSDRTLHVTVGSPDGGGAAGPAQVPGAPGGGYSALVAPDASAFLIAGGGGGACAQQAGGAGGGNPAKQGDGELGGGPGASAGGAGGPDNGNGRKGMPGSALTGGAGGGDSDHQTGGGGGGAGFFGGGGGGSYAGGTSKCGGGGGGSGYYDPAALHGTTVTTNNGEVGRAREPRRGVAGEPGQPGRVLVFCGASCPTASECGPLAHCSSGRCYPNALGSPCQADGQCGGFKCDNGQCQVN